MSRVGWLVGLLCFAVGSPVLAGAYLDQRFEIVGVATDGKQVAARFGYEGNNRCKYPIPAGLYIFEDLSIVVRSVPEGKHLEQFKIWGHPGRGPCTATAEGTKRASEANKELASRGFELTLEKVEFQTNANDKRTEHTWTLPASVAPEVNAAIKVSWTTKYRPKPKNDANWEVKRRMTSKLAISAEGFGSTTLTVPLNVEAMHTIISIASLYRSPSKLAYMLKSEIGHLGIPVVLPLSHISARLLNARGLDRHAKKNYQSSADDFAKAFALDPGYGWATFNLACAQALLGRKKEAFEALRSAIALKPGKFKNRARKDEDLASLRGDPEFAELLK